MLWVRVKPRARREAVGGLHGEALCVALRAPPVEGAANKALLKTLAAVAGVAPSTLEVLSGHASREKRVAFRTVDPDALAARIEEASG